MFDAGRSADCPDATSAFLLPFSAFLGWASWDYVAASWAVWEGSRAAGGLPGLFLVKSLIPLAAVLTFLQGLALMAGSLCTLAAGHTGSGHS